MNNNCPTEHDLRCTHSYLTCFLAFIQFTYYKNFFGFFLWKCFFAVFYLVYRYLGIFQIFFSVTEFLSSWWLENMLYMIWVLSDLPELVSWSRTRNILVCILWVRVLENDAYLRNSIRVLWVTHGHRVLCVVCFLLNFHYFLCKLLRERS